MKKFNTALLSFALFGSVSGFAQQGSLYVDTGTKGHEINPGMYGIFFEEINHSGDGGLYAELIQNRGFEEQTIPGGFHETGTDKIATDRFVRYTDLVSNQLNWDWNYAAKSMTGWKVEGSDAKVAYDVLTPEIPLHENTPNAMRMVIESDGADPSARLINTGYWGIAVEKGEKYNLRFYVNSSESVRGCEAYLVDSDGKRVGEVKLALNGNGEWQELKAEITAEDTLTDAEFVLQFNGNGTVWVDYVSLFPQKTFKNRDNGMRPDIAEMLAGLKPNFMRWPGGCIVEGIVLDNRVKWKETIGDPMTRPGQYDLWGYRSTWGMGYHEILQFCEDLGMDCMFVGNAGLSCIGWGGQYVAPGSDLDPYYEDIRDAIEYAIGDPATNEWAARRAEAGHPEPFPLKYVEIGNENFGLRYDANYKYIYERLKKEYPDLTFINTMGLDHAVEFDIHTDMIDPHWYVAPEFFYNNRSMFDQVPRGNYEIYVGEYATNVRVGQGNMDAALSEAVFMMDMERNSDIVKMASYAPLIENSNARNWTCNLIWQRSGEVFGRASYHVQKLFSENIPTYNVPFALQTERLGAAYSGRVGLGTWLTTAKFRNMTVTTPDGKKLYSPDFAGQRQEWTDMQGTWNVNEDSEFVQTNSGLSRCISLMNTLAFNDCVIEVEACKIAGSEGFLIVFGADDDDWGHYYQFNIGGWGNKQVGFEEVTDGTGAVISERPDFTIANGKWYKIKVVCSNGRIEGYIDDQLYCSHDFGTIQPGRIAAHAGFDEKSNATVVKVVNAESEPLSLKLHINANLYGDAEKCVLKSATLFDENSFSTPDLISPYWEKFTAADGMEMEFDPYSLTILKIYSTPAVEAMEMPGIVFTSDVRELNAPEENGKRVELKEAIEEAEKVAFSDLEGYEALLGAVEEARSILNLGEDTAYASAIDSLRKALNAYYKLQMIPANELEGKIVNGDFSKDGDNTGWSGNPVVRSHVAEIFNAGFNVSQTIEGLDDGYYMVYFQGHYRNGSHPDANARHADGTEELLARFSLNDMEKPVVSLMGEVHDGYWWGAPNTMEETWAVHSENSDHYANYLIAKADDGKLTISLHKSKLCDTDWFIFGNVRLFKVATSAAAVDAVDADLTGFSPDARIYDLQGRLVGSYSGLRRLTPGVYVVKEGNRAVKICIR